MARFEEDPDWRAKLQEHAHAFLEKVADEVKDDAQTLAPVQTGALRESIRVDVEGDTAHIGSDLKYSLYVEEGHRVVVTDHAGKKHWTGTVVPGQFYLQGALYQERGY